MVNFVPVTDTNEYVFVSMFSDYMFYDLKKYSYRLQKMFPTRKDATTKAYSYLFNYFYNPDKYHIYLIENRLHEFVGFCVIADYPLIDSSFGTFFIEEFYIKEKHRRQGYGESVAKSIIGMYNTKGALAVLKDNISAKRFWEKMFSKYAIEVKCDMDVDFDDITLYNFLPVVGLKRAVGVGTN